MVPILITPQELVDFETEIAKEFNSSKIKAPVHLYDGNEEQILSVFHDYQIGEDDWVFSTWRSHYQCLLKGVPKDKLRASILDGRSISLCFKEYKILCSAIVTGVLPIALGVALSLKRGGKKGRVFVWSGDMTSQTGIFHECRKYAEVHNLPIVFIIEDNGKSVCTDTEEVWGCGHDYSYYDNVEFYKYGGDKYPHAGAGKRVQF